MSSERTTTTAEPAARLADIDIEPQAANLERVQQPAAAPPPPSRATVVRDLPRNSPQVEQSSIVRHSEDHIGDVFAALAAAQGQFGEIERTLSAKIKSEKADYSYDYAPLDEVLQAVRPALSANGLSLMQFPFAVNGAVTVRTLLGHASGGWFFNDLKVTSDDNSPRSIGSAITYARRYALMSMLGVAPAVDDDGGAANPKGNAPHAGQRSSEQTRQPAPAARPPAPAAAPRPSTPPAAAAPAPRPVTPPAAPPAAAPAPPPAAPAAPAPAKPAGRAAKPAKPAQAAPAGQAQGEPQSPPAAPPAASQSVEEGLGKVGKIADLQEKPNGSIVTLDTGFRAAAKDAEHARALKVHRQVGATIKLTTRESSDPTRFAPVITQIDIVPAVVREREPGEEG